LLPKLGGCDDPVVINIAFPEKIQHLLTDTIDDVTVWT